MKLAVDSKLLADLVSWAARAIPPRPAVPILSGLLLEADGDLLAVSAFDYDMSVRGTAAADIAEPGRTLLPGRVLAEVVKSLPTTSFVDFTATDTEATLRCGRSEFSLPTMPIDDYPKLPTPPETAGTIDADTLAAAVAQVHPATSKDDTLPMLTGIRLDTDGNQLTLAATDRYRIAVRDTTWTPTTGQHIGVLIPGRHLHDIARALGHGTVQLGVSDSLAAFTCGDRQTTVRLLDPQFIDYRARTNMDAAITATVDAPALAAAVKRVAIVAERTTAIHLSFAEGEVTVQAGTEHTGRGADTVPCKLDGNPIKIAFQSQYLLDALQAIDGTAHIGMNTPTKPALIRSEDDTYQCLVMSLRTG